MRIRSLVAVGALLAATSAVAACGTDQPSRGSAASTSSDPGHGTVDLTAGERTRAKKSLIELSDLPSGWSASGAVAEGDGSSSLSATEARKLTSCLRVPRSDIDTDALHWTSPKFSDPSSAATVEDDLTLYPSDARATAEYSTFSDPRTPQCLLDLLGPDIQRQITDQLQPGQSVGQMSASSRPFPVYGDLSSDIEIEVPILEGTLEAPVFIDLVEVLEGHAESTLTASNPGTPLASGVLDQLARAAAARMQGVA